MKKLTRLPRRFLDFIFIDKSTRIDQLENAADLSKSQEIYSSLSYQFLIMLAMAALISSLGLMSDSGVIIVGAMLIAPLMKPIISLSYGISVGDNLLKLRSCITLSLGVIFTVLIAYLSESILELKTITNQMTNRIEPNLFDLGVAIAAGIASAIALTRRNVADSLPGVAIAVAIVPPLCVAGISLSMGMLHAFYGSLLLFVVNLFAIVISAIIVFLLSGYGSIKYTLVSIPVLVIALAVLAFPLKDSLVIIEDKDRVQEIVETWLHENYPDNIAIHPADLNDIGVLEKPNHIFVFIELKSPKNGFSDQQISHIHGLIEKAFKKPVNLKIQLLLTQELLKYDYLNKDDKIPVYGNDMMLPRK